MGSMPPGRLGSPQPTDGTCHGTQTTDLLSLSCCDLSLVGPGHTAIGRLVCMGADGADVSWLNHDFYLWFANVHIINNIYIINMVLETTISISSMNISLFIFSH